MDKIKKIILMGIPMSICNFRCHYCYLAQRDECYQGVQPDMKYSPEQVGRALCQRRMGGPCFINFCADGETLLTKNIDQYVKAVLEEGHYVEFVTNLTVNASLDRILALDQEILKHLEFKCSFHYLELKKRGLLERFAENVHKIWQSGASANIEMTPSDELIPYIDEVKKFSIENFGALPHLSIARNDKTEEIEYLTNLPMEEYDRTWSQFESGFWEFKKTIFGVKQTGFCYAGKWSCHINLATGMATPCYFGKPLGDVFSNPDAPFPERPIGKCPIAHCYNGHALLTLGLIPSCDTCNYGDIRDRECVDGSHWLQPELKSFFNTKLSQSNTPMTKSGEQICLLKNQASKIIKLPRKAAGKVYHCLKKLVK